MMHAREFRLRRYLPGEGIRVQSRGSLWATWRRMSAHDVVCNLRDFGPSVLKLV